MADYLEPTNPAKAEAYRLLALEALELLSQLKMSQAQATYFDDLMQVKDRLASGYWPNVCLYDIQMLKATRALVERLTRDETLRPTPEGNQGQALEEGGPAPPFRSGRASREGGWDA